MVSVVLHVWQAHLSFQVYFLIVLCSFILIHDSFIVLLLLAQWFAPEERSRATAVGLQACVLGSAIGFLLMPNIVVNPEDMPKLLFVHAMMAIAAMVFILIYFPSTPPSPPSLAAIRDVSLHTKVFAHTYLWSDSSCLSSVRALMNSVYSLQ
jgi:sugar phosphate permease